MSKQGRRETSWWGNSKDDVTESPDTCMVMVLVYRTVVVLQAVLRTLAVSHEALALLGECQGDTKQGWG